MSAYHKCVRVDRDGVLRPPQRALSYPILTKALQEFLVWCTADRRQPRGGSGLRPGARYASSEELVLFNATPVRADLLAMTIPAMRPEECFDNCWRISQSDPSLRYAEGFALMCGSIPTHHAWLVDAEGAVQDPTWPTVYRAHAEAQPERQWSGRAIYMGIPIEQAAHRRWNDRRGEPMLLAAHEEDILEPLERGLEAFA